MMRLTRLTYPTALVTGVLLLLTTPAIAGPTSFSVASNGAISSSEPYNGTITGQSGGTVNSNFCGWIASQPNHTFKIDASGIVSLKLTVTEPNGSISKPFTLLIKNASDPSADPFCAIADPFSGIPAEIGGVWNPGSYNIFIGNFDQSGAAGQAAYTLKISQ